MWFFLFYEVSSIPVRIAVLYQIFFNQYSKVTINGRNTLIGKF